MVLVKLQMVNKMYYSSQYYYINHCVLRIAKLFALCLKGKRYDDTLKAKALIRKHDKFLGLQGINHYSAPIKIS